MKAKKTEREKRRDAERQLVRRAQAGEQSAMSTLIETHYRDMLNLALRYTKDPDYARDVLHESCVKVIIHLGKYRGEARFAAWMARIVVNTANLRFRHQRRFVSLTTEALAEKPSTRPDPERSAADRQRLGQTIDQLQMGRDGDANLFLRRFVAGQSLRMISQDLGVSEPSIKTRMHRARARLKHTANRESAV